MNEVIDLKETTNYKMKKPDLNDYVNIGDLNDNADVIDEELNKKMDKVAGKGLSANDYTSGEKQKLAGIEAGANKYTHPSSHPASIITQDSTHRFATDSEKQKWNKTTDDFNTHQADGAKHITVAERTKWNGAVSDIGAKSNLKTTNKTNLVNAVNELFTNVSDGKQQIGTAITDVDDKVDVPTDATFEQLADAIGKIETGIKWAGGQIQSSTDYLKAYQPTQERSDSLYYIKVGGLNFKPTVIIAESYDGKFFSVWYSDMFYAIDIHKNRPPNEAGDKYFVKENNNFYCKIGEFTLPISDGYRKKILYNWLAFE